MARIYFDACVFIEVAKGRFGQPQNPERLAETEACNVLLRMAGAGGVQIFTSTLTVAEAVHVGEVPPPDDVVRFLERLIFSADGRSVFLAIADMRTAMQIRVTWQLRNDVGAPIVGRFWSTAHALRDRFAGFK